MKNIYRNIFTVKDYNNCGVTQKIISRMANVSQSSLSRLMSSYELEPIYLEGKKTLRYSIKDVKKVLYELFGQHHQIEKKIHSFYNFKGGTGKTSICYQVSSHLALYGYKVLAIDADPQAHLSSLMGLDNVDSCLTLYDSLIEKVSTKDIIHEIFPGLDLIPSNLSMTRILLALDQAHKDNQNIIKDFLSSISNDYDFILIDTNPTISSLNRSVVISCDTLNIVCETQPLSINGLKILLDDLSKYNNIMNTTSPNIFIVPNKYEDKAALSAEAMTALVYYYSNYLEPDFAIRKSEDINGASKMCLPLSFFARNNSNALEDIIQLLQIFIKRASYKK